jgi:transposase InsO family protein
MKKLFAIFLATFVTMGVCELGLRFMWHNPYRNETPDMLLKNGRLRDELLNGEIFYTLREAQVLVEWWRQHYNQVRPHSARGYKSPGPEAKTVKACISKFA